MNVRDKRPYGGSLFPIRPLLMALWLLLAATASAQTVTLDAMLIHASDRPAALDRRLDRIEYRLRRIFQFEHYGFMGETRTLLTLPADTHVELGHGYTVAINASARGNRIHATMAWYHEDERLLGTSVSQRRGVPAILGGPPHEEGVLILVLEFR